MWRLLAGACAVALAVGCAGPSTTIREERDGQVLVTASPSAPAPTSTPAKLRAKAERRLMACLGWNVGAKPSPSQRMACVEESRAWCIKQGLEPGCGASGLWTRTPSWAG